MLTKAVVYYLMHIYIVHDCGWSVYQAQLTRVSLPFNLHHAFVAYVTHYVGHANLLPGLSEVALRFDIVYG